MIKKADIVVIGAGIIGLATARELAERYPDRSVVIVEKESAPAQHQSKRNSGVIHAGVYYEPGSLKARFCRQGLRDMYDYCRRHHLPVRCTGKLIVATSALELDRLNPLFKRCQDNGLEPEWLDAAGLVAVEPAIHGLAAIRVAESGITSYPSVADELKKEFVERGGEVLFNSAVANISECDNKVELISNRQSLEASQLVVCAGLQADRLLSAAGITPDFRIIPYRGEFYSLPDDKSNLVSHLIYPVPDPTLPFLGIHLTPHVDGGISLGPNAVQAWSREAYNGLKLDLRDLGSILGWPGFWKFSSRHLSHGMAEYRSSFSKKFYLEQVRKYAPSLTVKDLLPYRSGIRAQAMRSDGTLVYDFLLKQTNRMLHVCSAPSPAATSAFPIARHLADQLTEKAPLH